VIVGSPSSFGKGTVQRFFPLDKMVNGLQDYKPLGEIKITVQNFYRINGGSTQLKGVEPDIVLPDNFKYIKVGEKEYDHPLEWSQINKLNYNQNVFVVDNLEELKLKSKTRTDTSKIFKLFDENALRLKKREEETSVSLNFEEYKKSEKSRDLESDKYATMNSRTTRLLPSPTSDLSADKSNTSQTVLKERQEEWFRSIRKDVYLEECALIIQDMIKTTSKTKVAKAKN
jgi:carboxyl-terminal processing protease